MSLEHLVSLENYVPTIYKGVKEIEALIKSEDYLFDILKSIVDKEYARMFIQTCDEVGVERFEQILEITANPSIETLDFRKQRLLTRCNSTLPYSTIWLKIYLNAVLGQHNYELDIDYKTNIATLYGYLLDYSWAREVNIVIDEAKPCNMVFIHIPTLIENASFVLWQDQDTWNGDVWDDGNVWSEFTYLTSDQLVNYNKQTEQDQDFKILLNAIGDIRLNNTHIIQDATSTIQDGTIYVEFIVPETIKLLELVEILDKDNNKLLSSPCFIDTPEGTKIIIRLSCYTRKRI